MHSLYFQVRIRLSFFSLFVAAVTPGEEYLHSLYFQVRIRLSFFSLFVAAVTPGEEYFRIFPLEPTQNCKFPSKLSLLIRLFYEKFLDNLVKTDLSMLLCGKKDSKMITVWHRLVERIHFAAFLRYGKYATIAHRLSSCSYVAMRALVESEHSKIIKRLSIHQFLTALLNFYWERKEVQLIHSTQSNPASLQSSSFRCILCLEQMEQQTVTECGHVFCWTCISNWIREAKVTREDCY